MRKVQFCHIEFTDISFDEYMEVVDKHVKERKHLTISLLTLKNFVKSIFNKELKEALQKIDILIPTGKFLYGLVKKTFPGYQFPIEQTKDLITPFIKKYHAFPINFILMGGNLPGLNKLGINLKASFSQLKIIGAYPKLFLENKQDDVKTIIKKSEAHIFFVGIGEEKEQKWITENGEILPKTVSICVNRQIDVMCDEEKDIPFKFKMKNKEFIYILSKKPYRVFDFFVWAFVWVKWKLFLHKKKKENKTT